METLLRLSLSASDESVRSGAVGDATKQDHLNVMLPRPKGLGRAPVRSCRAELRMKIAIIGKHRAERLVSAVAGRCQAEIVLCGPIDVSSYVGLGTRYRHLALDADEAALLSALEDEQIDVVIPSLNPLDQEQTLPILAAACLRWSGPGRHAVVHSPAFADLATDKVYFHRIAVSRG